MFSNLKKIPTTTEVFSTLERGATFRGCGYRDRYIGTNDDADRVVKECADLGVACRDNRREDRRISKDYAALCVPGYSEIVTLYNIEFHYDNGELSVTISVFRDALAIGDKVYYMYARNNKPPYSFSLVDSQSSEISVYNLERILNEELPQRVGKATAKKLAAWVDYLNRKEAAAVDFLKNGNEEKTKFFASLDASGATYRVSGNNVYITNGALELKATVAQSGIYFDVLKVNARGEDAFKFILNNKIEL